MGHRTEAAALVAAATAGDESAFVGLVERYRRELQLHCYRMLGSLEDAEDMVQETVLRAWRRRDGFEGRSSFRAWLYRIATNACLDLLERRPSRVLARDVAPAGDPELVLPSASELPWLDPYPDLLLEGVATAQDDPEAAAVSKETIELAFLAAIQHLAPRRRAALILRDVLGWSAKDTAAALEVSVASVNSALQRARATMKLHLPPARLEWAPSSDPTAAERASLRRYIAAHESADINGLAELLREDVRFSAPPTPRWHDGRDAFLASARRSAEPGRFRLLATRANMQPATGSYMRRSGDTRHTPVAIDVLRFEDGLVAEITSFLRPDLFAAFGLPPAL
jgi:RNA polymerase sigma-70 factor (ECF subfamily)